MRYAPKHLLHNLRRLDIGVLLIALVAVGGTWGFVELAGEVTEGDTDRLDEKIVHWFAALPDHGWLNEIVRDCTAFGGMFVLTLVTLGVAAYLLARRMTHALVLLLFSVGGGVALSLLLKGLYQRDRPDIIPHGSHTMTSSFPSGHAMLSAIVWLTLAVTLARLERSPIIKAYFIVIGLFISFVVGISRIWLGVHWPTDVLAGWAAGCAWATFCWFATRYLQHRGKVEPPTDHDAAAAPSGLAADDAPVPLETR